MSPLRETYRQLFHLTAGTLIAALLHYQLIDAVILALATGIGLLFSLIVGYVRLPIIEKILQKVERTEERKSGVRGRGAVLFLAGSTLATVLFSLDIAVASVLILAIGDSLAPLVGRYGRLAWPLNPEKKAEGWLAASIAAGLAASLLVPLWTALASAAAAMVLETSLPAPKGMLRWIVDDNLLLPVFAGALMTLFMQL